MKALILMLCVLVSGCAVGPYTSVRPRTLNASHVIYFEQSDRIPKDVLMFVTPKMRQESFPGWATSDIIKAITAEMAKTFPEMAKAYGKERMFNAMVGRRILFIGYETPEQLQEVERIIDRLENCTTGTVPGDNND